MTTEIIDNFRNIVLNWNSEQQIKIKDVANILNIPDVILNDDIITSTIEKLASLFDVNKDGSYTIDDIMLLKEELNKININLYIGLIQLFIGILYASKILEKQVTNMTTEEFNNLIFSLIIFAILTALLSSNNFIQWSRRISGGQTNLDILCIFFVNLHDYITNSPEIKKIISMIFKIIKSGCCSKSTCCLSGLLKCCFCCSCEKKNQNANNMAHKSMFVVRERILHILEQKQRIKAKSHVITLPI